MNEDADKKAAPAVPMQAPRGEVPGSGSGNGADTALEAMIRKRRMGLGSDPTLPGSDMRRKAPKK